MTTEVSVKDSENSSIIESEILEEEEQEVEDVQQNSRKSSSVSTVDEIESATVKRKNSQETENYSEEFENEDEIEESVLEEDVESERVEVEEESKSLEDVIQSTSSSASASKCSSASIKIRCEINISDSAVKSCIASSDGENNKVGGGEGYDVAETRTTPAPSPSAGNNNTNNPQFTMDDEIRSWTPSDNDYNEESHLFEIGILNESMVNLLLMEDRKMQRERQRMKYKNGTRMSLSFTNERMREIERHNQILVRKIFSQSPSPQVMVSRTTTQWEICRWTDAMCG